MFEGGGKRAKKMRTLEQHWRKIAFYANSLPSEGWYFLMGFCHLLNREGENVKPPFLISSKTNISTTKIYIYS